MKHHYLNLHYPLALLMICVAHFCNAQQNLFNIPSGDITPKHTFFYQHQVNFYSVSSFESKSHFVYGLGRNWDVGLNLVDLPIRLADGGDVLGFNDQRGTSPLYPLLMVTGQKQFVLHDKILLNIGTQIGPNLTYRARNARVAHFTYATLRWQPLKRGTLIVGPYYSNHIFTGGRRHTAGWMFGYEVRLNKGFSLMGDFVSGQHKKSVSTFGGVYDIGKKTQLCLAALIPYPNKELPAGLVAELNIFGWDFTKGH